MTKQLREVLDEWAGEVRVPHDLADRVLRRRARRPWVYGAVAAGVAVVLAVVAGVVLPRQDDMTVRPAVEVTLPERPSPAPTDVRTDVDNMPPKKMIAAGNYAVSAYFTTSTEKLEGRWERARRTWWLLDPQTGTYEKTPYAWVDVAPGLQVAAVLEGEVMGRRVGILDLTTRQFLTWIDLGRDVMGLKWSPDGTKLLATAYTDYPGRWERVDANSRMAVDSDRTGFVVVDVPAKKVDFRPLPLNEDLVRGNDFSWSLDGTLVWELVGGPRFLYYSLDGRPHEALQEHFSDANVAALSPNGKLLLGEAGLPTRITDVATGRVAGRQQALQLHAWADDESVIAVRCKDDCPSEFVGALVLIGVDGTEKTQLTGYQNSQEDGAWQWVLTPR
ncbi:hypothetical protein [Nonomuraea typhae]|uniref:hypothetical protein n=1 Tax=Nonomuraea typhae TaxID=2603600 RepID=UPI0012F910AF|nr:hypothetical protein [Nonomuraea typhae]